MDIQEEVKQKQKKDAEVLKGGGKEVVRGRAERRGPTIYPCGIGAASSNCQCFTGCLASAIRYRPLGPRLQRVLPLAHPLKHPHATPSPWLSAPLPLFYLPVVLLPLVILLSLAGWWEGPWDLPLAATSGVAPGESLLGPFRSR